MYSVGRDLHIDAPLSNVIINRRPVGFIADRLVPVLNVSKRSDLYWKRNHLENRMYQADFTARAPKTAPKNVGFSVSSDNFYAKEYALAFDAAIEDIVNADEALDIMRSGAELITDLLMIDYEMRVAAIANTAANLSTTAQVSTAWSNISGSRPITDLQNQVENFRQRTTLKPNILVLPEQVAIRVRQADETRDLLFGDRGGLPTDQQIASLIGVSEILVPMAQVNTAGVGETLAGSGTLSNVWGNYAWLAHRQPGLSRNMDTWLQAFRWTNPAFGVPMAVTRLPYDQRKKVEEIHVSYYQDEKVISPSLAVRVESVI